MDVVALTFEEDTSEETCTGATDLVMLLVLNVDIWCMKADYYDV